MPWAYYCFLLSLSFSIHVRETSFRSPSHIISLFLNHLSKLEMSCFFIPKFFNLSLHFPEETCISPEQAMLLQNCMQCSYKNQEIDTYYHLIHNPYSKFVNCGNNVPFLFFCPRIQSGLHVAFSYVFSLKVQCF